MRCVSSDRCIVIKYKKIAQKIIYMLANAHQKVYMLSNITYYYGKETRYIHRSGED